ncbi:MULTISPECIES: YokU family protein [unclassified Bacillus (in: firmicutes)]|uniref:YokU family protein n=1 Tax=unclassified Bacillus (in: firmicutes) TaxID=185979 RepID=UPI001BE8BDFD|nr:YokU family protein [Bacillus sp. ISL-39]MBT2662423.1 YokU family protein [Bacillus sp. ISL-45]
MKKCDWCSSENVRNVTDRVFWELPDGSRAIQIDETPTVKCLDCEMIYQTDLITKEIEDQLFLINTKKLDKVLTFEELMTQPRILKRNYFDFSS